MIQHVIKDDNLKSMGHNDGVKIVETYILNWKKLRHDRMSSRLTFADHDQAVMVKQVRNSSTSSLFRSKKFMLD